MYEHFTNFYRWPSISYPITSSNGPDSTTFRHPNLINWSSSKGGRLGELEHYPEYKYGWCQQIVDESHRHGVRYTQYDHLRNDRTQFSTKGDSRSAIFDIEGSFKGLLVGGVTLMDYSSFIPVEELFADICRLTGASEVRMLDLDILVSVLV